MTSERQQLTDSVEALQAQRSLLGDAVVDAAIASLRERLKALEVSVEGGEQLLKQVSVLFADIVASTELSHGLDPEDIHAVMDGALVRFTAVVDKFGGHVLQYAGDSVLAAFGVRTAREDDAERAVRAGLAIVEQARQWAAQVQAQHRLAGFDVRVGIDTGAVLLGGGVDAQASIRGITVNIAARMQQIASPGSVRVTHTAYRHVRGLFDVREQPPVEVKGIAQPVRSYLVERAKPRAFRVATRGIEGLETRMVGRERELALLQRAVESLFEQGKARAVTIVGDAGLGKSRLLYEFETWIEAGSRACQVMHARAQAQMQLPPYGLLRDVFAWWLQIADSDDLQTARRKLEEGVAPLLARDDGEDVAQAQPTASAT